MVTPNALSKELRRRLSSRQVPKGERHLSVQLALEASILVKKKVEKYSQLDPSCIDPRDVLSNTFERALSGEFDAIYSTCDFENSIRKVLATVTNTHLQRAFRAAKRDKQFEDLGIQADHLFAPPGAAVADLHRGMTHPYAGGGASELPLGEQAREINAYVEEHGLSGRLKAYADKLPQHSILGSSTEEIAAEEAVNEETVRKWRQRIKLGPRKPS